MAYFTPFRFKAGCATACVALIAFAGVLSPAAAQSREVMAKAMAAPAKAKEVPKAPGQPRGRTVVASTTHGKTKASWNDGNAMNTEGMKAYRAEKYAQARAWFQKAADAGDAGGMYNLGMLYADGNSVQQDYAQARAWFQKAADAGNTDAMYNLGMLYKNGWGVQQDYAQARAWFQKAADAGSADAKEQLEMIKDK